MYRNFAVLYDELMDDVDYKEWYSYIKEVMERFDKEPKDILEMACGTGNLSYYFAQEGYNLTCFDLSFEMLSVAENKLRKFKNVKLLNLNMIEFQINRRFDGIVSICDSINYITDKGDLLKVFENARKHLTDDGIFIFDINSFHKLKNIIGNNIFSEDRERILYIWQSYFDKKSNISEFDISFFVKNEDGLYKRFDEKHIQKAYMKDEIVDLLRKANFSEIYYYDGLSFDKINDKSQRINFVVLP